MLGTTEQEKNEKKQSKHTIIFGHLPGYNRDQNVSVFD